MIYAGPLGRQSHKLVEYFEVSLYVLYLWCSVPFLFSIVVVEMNYRRFEFVSMKLYGLDLSSKK